MARNVTLLQLRTDIAAQCDFSTSVAGRYTSTLLNRIINQSIQRFRERITITGLTHYLVSYSGTMAAGPTSSYAFQSLDLSALNPSVVRIHGIDITVAGVVVSLAHRPFEERNDFTSSPTMTGQPRAWANFQTRSVAIMPAPDTAYPYTVWYMPVLADLSADGDTFDGVAGWEVWVMWDCVCQLIARDQYATAYTQAMAERDLAWADIVRSSTKVSSAGGANVGRDTMGQAGLWGRQPLRNVGVAAGSAGVSANSILGTPTEAGDIETTNVDLTTSLGFSWQKRRHWIIPNVDLTGEVAADAAIQAALNARFGACVYIPEGKIKLSGGITITRGSTLTGPERGMQMGDKVYTPGEATPFGPQFQITNTSDVTFTLEQSACVRNIMAFYPNQATNATPTAYNYLFDVPQNAHGTTVENIAALTPYKLYRCNAAAPRVNNIWAFPLSRGIDLLRVADTARISNVHFNPTLYYAIGATLTAWVQANGIAYQIGGAEEFNFTDCFAWGYRVGLFFTNYNPGGSQFSYGSWKGGGFDQTQDCISIDGDSGLSIAGLRLSCVSLVPTAGAGAGHGIYFQDSRVPAGMSDRPAIYASDVTCHGVHDRSIWMVSGSYGVLTIHGGMFTNQLNDTMRLDSATAHLSVSKIAMASTATRTGGTSAGLIVDTDPISIV